MQIKIVEPKPPTTTWPNLECGTLFRFTNGGRDSTIGVVIENERTHEKRWMLVKHMNNSPSFPLGTHHDCSGGAEVVVLGRLEFEP